MQSSLVPVNRKPVLFWLCACLLMVMLMVVVGGLTRLTDSGLSMVDWHPIHGILPPMNETEWLEELENYRQSPQYQQINKGMSVDEFKGIFWLEYIHRVLGRIVGLIFFLPFAFFIFKRMISVRLSLRLFGVFLLGGAQGLMGWYMVKSGLADVPWVSPLRLMAHLSLAFILFCLLWWHILLLAFPDKTTHAPILTQKLTIAAFLLLFVQIMLGALVAGLDAGLVFDSFPKMNGEWIPAGMLTLEPAFRNLYENPTAAHFIHRAGALMVTLAIAALAITNRKHLQNHLNSVSVYALLGILAVQIALGAMTVIYHVPITIAVMHQFVALLVFAALLSLLYSQLYKPNWKPNSRLPATEGIVSTSS